MLTGVSAFAGLWYLRQSRATPQGTGELPAGWQKVRTRNGSTAVVVTEHPTSQSELPFQPGMFWFQEKLPQPLNPLQYATVLYLHLQRQNEVVRGLDVRWVSLYGWPVVQLVYAAVQQGQPYEGVLWIWTDGWDGYVMSFIAPLGTLEYYAQDLPSVVTEMADEIVPEPGPLADGSFPEVWTDEYWQAHEGGEATAWDWGGIDFGAPSFDGFEDPFAGATGDPFAGTDEFRDVFWDVYREHDQSTWANEEWAQVLGRVPPEPTWMDEAGSLYWEGSSGTLHEWSTDYPSDW